MPFNWTCTFCNAAQAVTDKRYSIVTSPFYMDGAAEGKLALEREVIVCSNPECERSTIHLRIGNYQTTRLASGGTDHKISDDGSIFNDLVAPRSSARPQPAYIPAPLREDYEEACLIAHLSPKASATLARRCLQGIIRDFAGISKRRLIDEINALKAAIDDGTADRSITPETVVAIDHVRSLGNIGAHMEADIDLIVPVDPGEAQAIIQIIEMLFDEWYGGRERRNQLLAEIEKIRVSKDELKRDAKEADAGGGEAVSAPEGLGGAAAFLGN